MIIKSKELMTIVSIIEALTTADKNIPGVMFDISEDGVKICFSDGRKAFIYSVDAVIGSTDEVGKYVVNVEQLGQIVKGSQSAGSIIVKDLDFTFEAGKVTIKVDQFLEMEPNEDGTENLSKKSTKTYSVPYTKAGEDIRSSVLIRTNYDNIFKFDGADIWNLDQFKEYLNILTSDENKSMYMVAEWGTGFVSHTAHLTAVPIESPFSVNIQLSTPVVKSLVTVLSKVKNLVDVDTIYVGNIDNAYLTVFTEDCSFGLMLPYVKAQRLHVETLKRYQEVGYDTFNVILHREMFADAVKTAAETSAVDKTALKFSRNGSGEVVLSIRVGNSNKSTSNEFDVTVEDCIETDDITQKEFPIGLKTLGNMLSKLRTEYVALDMTVKETGETYLRLGELNLDKLADAQTTARAALGLEPGQPTPIETKIGYRKDTLDMVQYTTLQKG